MLDLITIIYSLGIIFGLLVLWWSSDKTVESSIKLSEIFGITTFFIGFVLIAISTGLPELAITIASLWDKVPGVAAGTIIGSNLGDISLVLGVPAILLGTINAKKEDKLNLMFLLMVTSLVMALVFIAGILSFWYGPFLVILYFSSIIWLWKTRSVKVVPHKEVVEELGGEEKLKRKKALRTKVTVILKLFGSLFLVVLSSKISIDCAIVVAKNLKFSLISIGATVFAIGTSLPELALSLQAVRKREYSMAFGNAFGSVLEQATLILGILVIGSSKPVDISMLRPIAPLMFLSYAIVAHSLLKKTKVGKKVGLGRFEGVILLVLFSIHIVYYLFWGARG